MTHHNPHDHQQDSQHAHEPALAEMLDRDALLLRKHLQEIFDWVAERQRTPRTILDLGAGTGTGTIGLVRTFPQANVVAVDQSEFMLEYLASAVKKQHFEDRVSTMNADLDTHWPDLADIDLVWAASSLHHMSDPTQTLRQVRNTLSPDGLLVVVEMDTLPRHLPDDLGFGAPGLEQRIHNETARAGWNAHPDWASNIREAGMEIIEQRTFTYETSENRELIAQNALSFLSRIRDSVQDALSADDVNTIDQLLDPGGSRFLPNRTDLTLRGSRTVWAARPAHKRP